MATTATIWRSMTTTTIINTADASAGEDWELVNPDIKPLANWQTLNEDVGGEHSLLIEYYKRCISG